MIKNKIKPSSFRGGGGGGGGDSPPPYNPANDPGYKEATELLKKLGPQMDKANKKMTQAEIMMSLPALQRALIAAQQKQSIASKGANWGAINNFKATPAPKPVKAVFAPVYRGGMYNGPNRISPASLNADQNFVYQAGLLGSAPNQGQ